MAAKRKKPRSVLRNLLIVLAVFVPVLLVVLYARGRDRAVVLILPEEHAQREAQRVSPDNGFPLLLEAANLLPGRPNPVDPTSPDQGERPWEEPAPADLGSTSLAELCLITLPDSDPQVAKYIQECAPAAAKAAEALAKPLLIFPAARRFRDDQYEREVLNLGRAMVALGRVQFESAPTAESLAPLLNAIRLSRALCRTESVINWAKVIEGSALQQLRLLGTDPARHAALLPALEAFGPGYVPRSDLLQTAMLHLDDQLARQESVSDMRGPQRMFRGAFLYEVQRVAEILHANRAEVLGLADSGPSALDRWLYQNAGAERGPDDPFGILRRLNLTMRRAGELSSDYQATRISLALAGYKAGEGKYPDKLADLAPKYIAEVPLDPFINGPFGYKAIDGKDAMLYSTGYDNTDDGGLPEKDRIIEATPGAMPPAK